MPQLVERKSYANGKDLSSQIIVLPAAYLHQVGAVAGTTFQMFFSDESDVLTMKPKLRYEAKR